MTSANTTKILVIGAGPAGLACAYELAKQKCGLAVEVVEADKQVGGLSKTVNFNGYYYDIGGHRFFTKINEVNQLWREVLPNGWLTKRRLSRIFFQNKFFDYPLNVGNIIYNFDWKEAVYILGSYLRAKLFPVKSESSFQDWIIDRFGFRLFRIFFKAYTEKLWGLPCREISAEWAAQRIKGLSLSVVVRNAVFGRILSDTQAKTLIKEFQYPKYGPSMVYGAMADHLNQQRNIKLSFNTKVEFLEYKSNKWVATVNFAGRRRQVSSDYVVSTMPVTELILALSFSVPAKLKEIARKLRYRGLIVVCLVFNQRSNLRDNWLYIHEPNIQMGRLQIINNWSRYMVKEQGHFSCAGEYFCSAGDRLWEMSDKALVNLAIKELRAMNLATKQGVCLQGRVIRIRKVYPVYDKFYQKNINILQGYIKTLPRLQVAGRCGMFKYNNMDHSILTGLLAARNIIAGRKKYDLWQINQDEEYQEY